MSYALVTLLILLQFADAWTTHRLLSNGGRELNPVMDKLFRKVGLVRGLVLKVVFVSVLAVFLIDYPLILTVLCILYVVVVLHNFVELVK
jgi:uncharacterized protein YacL